jgi:hypothetical protein
MNKVRTSEIHPLQVPVIQADLLSDLDPSTLDAGTIRISHSSKREGF